MISRSDVEQAAAILRRGGLVAFPTETVYGLGANALDPSAVRVIFEAKGRPLTSPLIVHVANVKAAQALSREWPDAAELLARAFWPGPLTIVVPKQPVVPDLVTAGLDSVALRIPSHPVALELLEAAGIPLAAPSANRFTQLSPTTAQHVREGLGERVEMILDGGPCSVGIESTVVSFAGGSPRILRPGMISRTEIEEVIGPVESGAGPESPGQHRVHYSPRTRLVLGRAPVEGRGIVLDLQTQSHGPAEWGAQLYAKLHDLDHAGYDWIAVQLPPDTPEWAGVRDRLMRAARG